jgi:hypothetical protein
MAAKSYLKGGIGFSYNGSIGQLTSKYGNGFSKKDATAAVKSLKPSWKKQALIAARAYMASGIGFLHESLLAQLTSSYGSQFTKAQARYAVAKVGLYNTFRCSNPLAHSMTLVPKGAAVMMVVVRLSARRAELTLLTGSAGPGHAHGEQATIRGIR